MHKVNFEAIDQFKRKIRLTGERFAHILEHPELRYSESDIKETILFPEAIKESKHDKKVWVYYKFYQKTPVKRKFMAVIIKILNGNGFVITAYYTDKIKEGRTIWQR
ncbi:hypothetical protein HZC34_00055 [Candidatus Saganbacteria bacterium]|nr:hypothetical protein [Candidatus Saganbacteria bacterium]